MSRTPRLSTLFGPEFTRLRMGLFGIGLSMMLGMVGYQVVSDATVFEAFYMTIITISTVGYEEVVQLGPAGQWLTIAIILTGVISLSIVAVSTAEVLFEGHLRRAIEGRRMERKIEALRGHVIICGYGRVGIHVAEELEANGAEFVIVDEDPEKMHRLEMTGHLFIEGDATEEHVLEAAGLDHASAVVAAVNSDADNVLITLTAKGLSPSTEVIARAKLDENERKLRRAGADRVIAPTTIGGRRIAQLLTRPAVADFLDRVAAGSFEILLEEVPVKEGSDLAGRTLRDARIRERFACTVVAIRAADQSMDTHPKPDRTVRPGDVIVVMGDDDHIQQMRSAYA